MGAVESCLQCDAKRSDPKGLGLQSDTTRTPNYSAPRYPTDAAAAEQSPFSELIASRFNESSLKYQDMYDSVRNFTLMAV